MDTLAYKKQMVYEKADAKIVSEAFAYAENYKKYLDLAKTEREAVKCSVEMAEKFGFSEYKFGDKLVAGDKKYYNNRGKNLTGARIYVALFPCNECAKAIIQSGIREVVYLSDKYARTSSTQASKRLLASAGVRVRQFITKMDFLTLHFKESK